MIPVKQARAETTVALSGAPIPDEPLPEELEIARITRHVRILQARLRAFEAELEEAKAVVTSRGKALDTEWVGVAIRHTQEIREKYHTAAEQLRATYAEYRAWAGFFLHERQIPFPKIAPLVYDTNGANVLIDPLKTTRLWKRFAVDTLAAVQSLQAEIDTAIGRPIKKRVSTDAEEELADLAEERRGAEAIWDPKEE